MKYHKFIEKIEWNLVSNTFFEIIKEISFFTTIPTPRRRWKAHSGFSREDLKPQTDKAPKTKKNLQNPFRQSMYQIHKGCQQNRDNQFHAVTGNPKHENFLKRINARQPKTNKKDDKSINQLRNDSRTCASQPNHASVGQFVENTKQLHVHQLRNQKCRDASNHDGQTSTKSLAKFAVAQIRFRICRHFHRDVNQKKAKGNQSSSDVTQSFHGFLAEIIVHHIGQQKNNRPRNDPRNNRRQRRRHRLRRNQLRHNRAGNKNPCENGEDDLFF